MRLETSKTKAKGYITVYIPKKRKGDYFDNLGMLTTLLAERKQIDLRTAGQKPLIVMLNGSTDGVKEKEEFSDDEEAFRVEKQQFNWGNDKEVSCNLQEENVLSGLESYGFANQHSEVFLKLQEEIPSIIDVPDPDHMTQEERRLARIAHEQTSFDPNHYLADLMEDDQIQQLIQFKPVWIEEHDTITKAKENSSSFEVSFSENEKAVLKELPNKEYLLDYRTERIVYLGLVDIMFAYAYNHRTTEGENSVESAWTICKLSTTLSWMENFNNCLQDVVFCCVRRSLCYPLYRHWSLIEAVLNDIKTIFKLGKYKLLQCLLSIRQILNSAEPYYILNNLYITDYCVWIQHVKSEVIQSLADDLDKISVEKSSMGFDLPELEEAAYLVLAEEEQESEDEDEEEELESNNEEEVIIRDEEEWENDEEENQESSSECKIKEKQQSSEENTEESTSDRGNAHKDNNALLELSCSNVSSLCDLLYQMKTTEEGDDTLSKSDVDQDQDSIVTLRLPSDSCIQDKVLIEELDTQ